MTASTIFLFAAIVGSPISSATPAPATAIRFDSGTSARRIPIEVAGEGLAFVKGKVRDVDAWFLLNTASPSVLSKGLAERLGLAAAGEETESATAPHTSARTLREVAVRLPGVEVTQFSVSSFDLETFQTALGHKVDGILGVSFFERVVVEIDYARAQIAVADPRAHRFAGAPGPIPIRVEAGLPYIEGTVALARKPPLAGWFLLDTGTDNAVILFSPFVASHSLLGGAAKITPQAGPAEGTGKLEAVIRAEDLALGPFHFREPVVQLSRSTAGLLADSKHAGLVGGAVLSRFRVTLDLPHGRVWLEKNRRYDEPFLHDASGLSLVALGPDLSTFLIRRVSPSSPGSEAGFAAGDVVVAIDGKPAKDVGLRGLRRLLEVDGHKYLLTIYREGQIKKVTILCRRQL